MKPVILEQYNGSQLGLYDADSAPEYNSILASKVIDVSPLCPNSVQCVIKYAHVICGTIAQICDWRQKGVDFGCTLHYHINEYTAESLAADVVFQRRSSVMGANPIELAKTIFENQPEKSNMKKNEKQINYEMVKEIKKRMFNNEKTTFAERNIVNIYEKRRAKKQKDELKELGLKK